MKYCLLFCLLACGLPVTYAAHFEYYAGGFTASCENYCEDYYYIDGPYSANNTGADEVFVEDLSMVLQAGTLARSHVVSGYFDHSLHFRAVSFATAMSFDTDGSGNCSSSLTAADGETLGVFYRIEPDAGEAIGDEVVVYWDGEISIEPTGVYPGTAVGSLAGSGSMDHVAITKGQLPPVIDAPDPDNEIWSMDNVERTNTFYYGAESVSWFDAQVGDVIGIFVSIGTGNAVSGYQSGTITSNLSATFTVQPRLKGDLDNDGDVDVLDFAEFADNWLTGCEGGQEPDSVGHWTMDDNADDNIVHDISGYGNDGTAQQNTSSLHTQGQIDGALMFDGSTDYVAIPDSSSLSPSAQVTVTGWFYFGNPAENVGLVWKDSYNFALYTAYGEVRFSVWNWSSEESRASFATSALSSDWNFIAAVFDDDNSTLYLGGAQHGTDGATISGGIRDRDGDLYIGVRPDNVGETFFDGTVDDVRVFDKALSSQQIQGLYTSAGGS